MKYQFVSDNIEMSPSMEALAKEKFARIESRAQKVKGGPKFARIVMNKAPEDQFQVKAKVVIKRDEYFSDETSFTLENALINTVDELIEMMEKDKRR